jgi:hypothetical protein
MYGCSEGLEVANLLLFHSKKGYFLRSAWRCLRAVIYSDCYHGPGRTSFSLEYFDQHIYLTARFWDAFQKAGTFYEEQTLINGMG